MYCYICLYLYYPIELSHIQMGIIYSDFRMPFASWIIVANSLTATRQNGIAARNELITQMFVHSSDRRVVPLAIPSCKIILEKLNYFIWLLAIFLCVWKWTIDLVFYIFYLRKKDEVCILWICHILYMYILLYISKYTLLENQNRRESSLGFH